MSSASEYAEEPVDESYYSEEEIVKDPPSYRPKNNILEIRDHYSLGRSTELRFRGRKDQKAYVLDNVGMSQQLVVLMRENENEDETKDHQHASIEPGIHSRSSFGSSLLRAIAACVSFFVLTVWVAFTMQCIFFLFMNVVGTYTPAEWTANPPIANLLGCVFACPVLVDSLGQVLTMSLACTVDCWRGIASHHASLWKTKGKVGGEWVTLVVFFFVPILTFAIATLLAKERDEQNNATLVQDDNVRGWFELTMLSWFGSVVVFQIIYMDLCFWSEVTSCHKLLQHLRNTTSVLDSIKTNLVLTQRQKYSGVRRERYIVDHIAGDDRNDPSHCCGNRTSFSVDNARRPVQWKYTVGTRITKLLCCFYDNIEVTLPTTKEESAINTEVKRNYTLDEIFGNIRIVTRHNWSLQKVWCNNPERTATISILSGRDSVTRRQFLSGVLCVVGAMALIIISVFSFLIWFGNSLTMIIAVVCLIVIFCFFPMVVSLFKMGERQRKRSHDVVGSEDEEKSQLENDIIVSVWESVRVTELKEWMCFVSAAVEIMAFFLWPVTTLFFYENTNMGIVFLVFGIHTVSGHYFNASALLQDTGPIDDLDMSELDLSLIFCSSRRSDEKNTSESENCRKKKRDTKNKAFLANIFGRVTKSPTKKRWLLALVFFYFICFIAYLYASSIELFSEENGFVMGRFRWKGIVLADGFYWEAQPHLQYPTCEIGSGFNIPGEDLNYMADWSFLGTMSFANFTESQPLIDQWFGNGVIIDDSEYVQSYRRSVGLGDHPVEFKLFTLANDPNSAVVAIRGTEARWDWLADAQLWIGGVLAQAIKNINPLGYMWDPILDEVVFLMNLVQSKRLKEVSYYRFTSDFVEALYNGYEGRSYENLRVTGVSLGGGLSILTGAITGAPAISFSGLNAMYSRRTFLPKITEHQLNTRVFNTIPQRDLIANIDKPGLLYQNIQCTAPKQDFLMGCHSMFRTLCEYQYKCGSQGRPINCLCVSKYGYPVPTQNGTVTWEEACAAESTAPGTE